MKLVVLYLALVYMALVGVVSSRSVIIANYHNVIMFFPKELGGNDDVRVIFDVRNVTEGTVSFNRAWFLLRVLHISKKEIEVIDIDHTYNLY